MVKPLCKKKKILIHQLIYTTKQCAQRQVELATGINTLSRSKSRTRLFAEAQSERLAGILRIMPEDFLSSFFPPQGTAWHSERVNREPKTVWCDSDEWCSEEHKHRFIYNLPKLTVTLVLHNIYFFFKKEGHYFFMLRDYWGSIFFEEVCHSEDEPVTTKCCELLLK